MDLLACGWTLIKWSVLTCTDKRNIFNCSMKLLLHIIWFSKFIVLLMCLKLMQIVFSYWINFLFMNSICLSLSFSHAVLIHRQAHTWTDTAAACMSVQVWGKHALLYPNANNLLDLFDCFQSDKDLEADLIQETVSIFFSQNWIGPWSCWSAAGLLPLKHSSFLLYTFMWFMWYFLWFVCNF